VFSRPARTSNRIFTKKAETDHFSLLKSWSCGVSTGTQELGACCPTSLLEWMYCWIQRSIGFDNGLTMLAN
jgi:hypothetical protein